MTREEFKAAVDLYVETTAARRSKSSRYLDLRAWATREFNKAFDEEEYGPKPKKVIGEWERPGKITKLT
jgi:hypothetical protein